MDITKLTDIELKALAFEQTVLRDQSIQNLNAIVGELNRRHQPQQPPMQVDSVAESTK